MQDVLTVGDDFAGKVKGTMMVVTNVIVAGME